MIAQFVKGDARSLAKLGRALEVKIEIDAILLPVDVAHELGEIFPDPLIEMLQPGAARERIDEPRRAAVERDDAQRHGEREARAQVHADGASR